MQYLKISPLSGVQHLKNVADTRAARLRTMRYAHFFGPDAAAHTANFPQNMVTIVDVTRASKIIESDNYEIRPHLTARINVFYGNINTSAFVARLDAEKILYMNFLLEATHIKPEELFKGAIPADTYMFICRFSTMSNINVKKILNSKHKYIILADIINTKICKHLVREKDKLPNFSFVRIHKMRARSISTLTDIKISNPNDTYIGSSLYEAFGDMAAPESFPTLLESFKLASIFEKNYTEKGDANSDFLVFHFGTIVPISYFVKDGKLPFSKTPNFFSRRKIAERNLSVKLIKNLTM